MKRVATVDDTDESLPTLNADIETEVKEMMGLFDVPAFARRGQDLEITLRRLHERCRNGARPVARHGPAAAPPVVARRRPARMPGRASSPARSSRSGRSREAEPPRLGRLARARSAGDAIIARRPDRRRGSVQSPLDAVPRSIEPRAGQCRRSTSTIATTSWKKSASWARLGSPPAISSPCPCSRRRRSSNDHPALPVPELRRSTSRLERGSNPFPSPTIDMNRLDIMSTHLAIASHGRASSPSTVSRRSSSGRGRRRGRPRPTDPSDDKPGSMPQRTGWPSRSPVPPTLRSEPIKGRVYVLLGPDSSAASRGSGPTGSGPSRSSPWTSRAGSRASRCGSIPGPTDSPVRSTSSKPGRYAIQAVVRLNLDTHKIGDGEGNAYGPVVHAELDPKKGGTVALKVDQIVEPRPFPATDRIKLVELPSPKLSAFYHRPIKHRAAVILPEEMPRAISETKRADALHHPRLRRRPLHGLALCGQSAARRIGKDFIRVVLDPDCGTGHHVFADSATNGPRGTALVEEFIPYIETHVPGHRRSPRPLAQRPFLRRLEQPLAPGDLSRRLRRHLVDQPRPGRFPRLSADRPLCRRREHVPRPRGQAPADRPDGSHARALSTTVSPGWTT